MPVSLEQGKEQLLHYRKLRDSVTSRPVHSTAGSSTAAPAGAASAASAAGTAAAGKQLNEATGKAVGQESAAEQLAELGVSLPPSSWVVGLGLPVKGLEDAVAAHYATLEAMKR